MRREAVIIRCYRSFGKDIETSNAHGESKIAPRRDELSIIDYRSHLESTQMNFNIPLNPLYLAAICSFPRMCRRSG